MRNKLLLLVLILPFALKAEKEIEIQSSITDVTVYQQTAQVTRSANANLPKGDVLIKFANLHQNINPNLVKFNGKGDFSILAVYHNYKIDTISGQSDARKVNDWRKERQIIVEQIQREQSYLDIYTRELTLLQNHQNFSSPQEGLKVEDLQKAADFLRERYFNIREQQITLEDRIKELNTQIYEIDSKINSVRGILVERSLEMYVRIKSNKTQTADLNLTYQVQGAGWFPSYDAKVDNIETPMHLEFRANVFQNTGEDWNKVNMTVATGNPNLNPSKPNLLPWYLSSSRPAQGTSYNNRNSMNEHLRSQPYNASVSTVTGRLLDEHGEPLPFASVAFPGTSAGTTTDLNGYYNAAVPANAQSMNFSYLGYSTVSLNVCSPVMNVILPSDQVTLDAVMCTSSKSSMEMSYIGSAEYSMDETALFKKRDGRSDDYNDMLKDADFAPVQVSYSPINTKYNIETDYSIPSDGKQYAVTLKDYELEADYIYQCAPKLDRTAYLMARVTGWEDYNLMEGKMNIYFEETYVGQTDLNLQYVDDTLSVSLGADPNIIIERKRLEAKNSKQFIGSKRKDVREWEISVRNNKKQTIHIQIEDQLPLTNNEEVEIERESLSGGEVDEITGQITWDLQINTGKVKTVDFKYALKYPKNMFLATN
jgi:hypothetical protein